MRNRPRKRPPPPQPRTGQTVDEWRRERWRWYCEEFAHVLAENKRRLDEQPIRFRTVRGHARIVSPPCLPYPVFPDDLRYLTCGARTRRGAPCRRRDLYACGRCKLHGGASTGPRAAREELQIRSVLRVWGIPQLHPHRPTRPRKTL